MTDGMFCIRFHFTKGYIIAVGDKNRIITKTIVAAWRPDKRAFDRAFDGFVMTIRPDKR